MYNHYTVLRLNGDCSSVGTWTSADSIERIVAVSTAYCGTHGRMAAIGSSWEYAVEGEDEYYGTIAQSWVRSLEGEGDEFRRSDYAAVLEGVHSFLSLPELAHA